VVAPATNKFRTNSNDERKRSQTDKRVDEQTGNTQQQPDEIRRVSRIFGA